MKSTKVKRFTFLCVAFCIALAVGVSACNGGASSSSSGISSENNPL